MSRRLHSFSFEEKVPNVGEADEVTVLSPHPIPLLEGEGTRGYAHG
jgi:hypothetical protein